MSSVSQLGVRLCVILILGPRLVGEPASQSLLITVVRKEKQAAEVLALEASAQKQYDFYSHFTVQNTSCSQTSLQMGRESRPIRLPEERARKELYFPREENKRRGENRGG